ncbi:MAG: N-acetyltransferase [Candidatus Omnitrophota bacterium]
MSAAEIRKAKVRDVGQIQGLINQFAKQELMLPRSLSNIYESLRDFWTCELNNRIIGCCALHVAWKELAEIRSLAVSRYYQKKGFARQLINAAINEAKELGCKSVFALTYVPDYFRKFGFRRVSKERLPHKIWAECIDCPKFPDCKEIALIKKL